MGMVLVALIAIEAQLAMDFLERCPSPLMPSAPVSNRSGHLVAPARVEVIGVAEKAIELRTCAYENHRVVSVSLEVKQPKGSQLSPGQVVGPGELLAEGGVLRIEGLPPRQFFRQHPYLWAPRSEPVLVVVDVEGHQARRYLRGERTHTFEVGRGQAAGEKEVRGDLKTPRGLYFVTHKSTGPFTGEVAEYYGGHWVKVNYPNAFDARRGVDGGFLSLEDAARIAQVWWQRRLPTQNSKLGGGIGFHGWVAPWRGEEQGYGLSWGCVVLHPEEVATFYGSVPVGAAVVLE